MELTQQVAEVRYALTDCEADYLLCLALDIGEAMLKSGAEVHRVEDTVSRLCKAYGAKHTEIFAIPTMINAAIRMEDGSYSAQLRRVYSSEYNLFKVELFNDISRKACRHKPALGELNDMIKAAKKRQPYSFKMVALGAALATGGFCVFFGGTWRDALVAAFVGTLMCLMEKLPLRHINNFAKTAMQSFVGGALSCLFVLWGIAQNADMVIMGTIMYSIPGLAIGVAFRDLLYGDFMAGTLKMIQTLLSALMIAFGYVIAMLVFLGGNVL